MKKLTTLIFIGLCFCFAQKSLASHVMGAEIHWESLGKDTFKLTLIYYRDCNGVNQDSAYIDLKSTCRTERVLAKLVSKTDITPLCKGVKSRCSNPTSSFNYGIEKIEMAAIFSTTNFINDGCCEIQLVFEQCCRNTPSPPLPNSSFYLEAKMNACLAPTNSSPVFDDNPISFICLNSEQVISFGVSDNDNDSIRYELTAPLVDSNKAFAYSGKYAFDKPIFYKGFPKTNLNFPEGFHFNKKTGTLMFVPTRQEQAFMAVKVTEYKQGKVISEITRDLMVVVFKCPSNESPVLSGINCKNPSPANFEIETCPNKLLEFEICSSDKDKGDTVTLNWVSEIPNASVSVINSGSKRERLKFSWKPSDLDYREAPYSFTVIAKDDACPLVGKTSRTYFIKVKEPGPAVKLDSTIKKCGQVELEAKTIDSTIAKGFEWKIGNDELKTGKGKTSSVKLKTKETGKVAYSITTTGSNNCKSTFYDTLNVENHLTVKTLNDTLVCFGNSIMLQSNTKIVDSTRKHFTKWSTGDSSTSAMSTLNFGPINNDTTIWVSTSDGFCSDTDWVQIKVRELPKFSLPKSKTICPGFADSIVPALNLDTTIDNYAVDFEWSVVNGSSIISNDTILQIHETNTYFLTLTDELGCKHTDSTMVKEDKSWSMPDTFVCEGESIKIEFPNQSNIMFRWKDKPSDTTTSLIGWQRALEPIKSSTFLIERVKRDGISICRIIDTFQLDVKPKPTVSISPDSIFTCSGNAVAFKANISGGNWKGPGVSSSAQDLNFTANAAYLGNNQIIYVYKNTFGCSNSDTSILTISEKPKAQFAKTDTIIKLGSKMIFKSDLTKPLNTIINWKATNPDTVILKHDSIELQFSQLGISTISMVVLDTITSCADTANHSLSVLKSVGFEDEENIVFNLFPNPTTGQITIGNHSEGLFQIFDLNGKVVFIKNVEIQSSAINLNHLENGVYFFQFENRMGLQSGKLILMK
ncbi:MAG: T9SS type A sorting domain-containing protein [Bacteroidia bacterium]